MPSHFSITFFNVSILIGFHYAVKSLADNRPTYTDLLSGYDLTFVLHRLKRRHCPIDLFP